MDEASAAEERATAPGAWVELRRGGGCTLAVARGGPGRADDARAQQQEPPPPLAPLQPGTFSRRQWAARYGYFVRCVAAMLRHRLEAAATVPLAWDWAGMARRLEAFMYRTSSSRYRSFVLLK